MTVAQTEHKRYLKAKDTRKFREMVRHKHDFYFPELVKQTMIMELMELDSHDLKALLYLKEILSEFSKDFYMMIIEGDTILLTSKKFHLVCAIGYAYANEIAAPFIPGEGKKSVLELRNIHSFKKGEGHKMVTRLIQLTNHLNIPTTLWTETDENTKYFEKYGFLDFGKLGDGGETLMIYFPQQQDE